MRRLVPTLLCLMFAASLHASVPSIPAAGLHQDSRDVRLDQGRAKQKLGLTAAPADNLSFYAEFYGTTPLSGKAERKGGFLHWFTSAVKKTAQKVNFFD